MSIPWPARTRKGQIQLCYPADWEARIYVTGMRADLEIWRQLPGLVPPVLFLRGSETDTFLANTARLVEQRLKSARITTIAGLDSPGRARTTRPGISFNHSISLRRLKTYGTTCL